MTILKISIPLLLVALASCKNKGDKDPIACLPNSLENGVIAYYTFGNGVLDDNSGYGHHLSNTTNASPSEDRDGNPNCAYQFDNEGTNSQYLNFVNPTFLDGLNSFSISLWYRHMQSSRSAGDYEGLVSRGPFEMRCPDRRGEWSLGLYDSRKAVFGHNNSVWATQAPDSVWNWMPIDMYGDSPVWHHLVCTKNSNTYKLYFDGILQQTRIGNANCGTLPMMVQDIGDLFIGKEYTGKIDDIIMYSRELSQNEVNSLLNEAACCE